MKTTYIYLNTYANGYMYVGSHTWDGPEGILDPNYHGSSKIAARFGWFPEKEEILRVVEGSKYREERAFIEEYAKRYGIAPVTKALSSVNNGWVNKFPDGLLLNAHSNDAGQLQGEEVFKKRYQTRSKVGWDTAIVAMQSEEARRRKSATYRAHGNSPKAATIASHTKEALAKMQATRAKSARYFEIDGVKYLLKDAAYLIGVSPRTAYRLYDKYSDKGYFVLEGVRIKVIKNVSKS